MELMNQSFEEMKLIPSEKHISLSKMRAYVVEWSFYVGELALMRHLSSDAKDRHVLSNMHLRNFGVPTSKDNAELKHFVFYSPEPSFQNKRLYLVDKTIFSAKNRLLVGPKNAYLDHHERLFAAVETFTASCIREYISPKVGTHERPIEQARREEIGFSRLLDRFHFKLILAIYIYIVDKKYHYKGVNNYNYLDSLLLNPALTADVLLGLLNRHWIWAFADSSGELSLFNRGIVAVPELNDAFFLSISRVWGLWISSTSDSEDIKATLGRNYRPTLIKGVAGLNGAIGEKINNYLSHNPDDLELFYPYAKKLAFHPDMDINSRPIVSRKEIVSQKYTRRGEESEIY
jgi:hypothetical protein